MRGAGVGAEEVQARAVAECHPRSSFQVSSETKERYNQCTNIECGHTFVTHETFVRSVCRPQKISAAPPHPKGMQEQLAY
ncbi:ogr/Delta-like zinc finger family protein [Enterobacter sichuanensis]|uniref:ogr/Delta-like zinc finger family protein n=2 Tax=Bacteria TaxID=2 RepID=UPI002DB8A856|nr:ogr/Delta-like zinc finger family protein [Enterobacter sichuanensis]MEB5959221.1 ogr/Delta-like zinc finger family protein [Enterobacter sichuanensis]